MQKREISIIHLENNILAGTTVENKGKLILTEETMSIIHLENNHRKINTLEEIEILKADLNSNCQLPKPGDRSDFNTHKTC